jgi:hypothetical protein
MKKRLIAIAIFMALLVFPTTNWAKEMSVTPGDEAALRLSPLQSKGYINISVGDRGVFILVEPKYWQAMMHKDKVNLCRVAITYARFLNQNDGGNREAVFIQDMTSKEDLSYGYIQIGKVEIFK